jgi:HK97 family phage prohead protease
MLFAQSFGELELRRDRSGEGRLRGRFPYGKTATLSDGGRIGKPRKETFAPGAFKYSLANLDQSPVHLLVGHSYDRPLASTDTGTLTLRDSVEALSFDAKITPEIASTTYGGDVLAQIASGIVSGLSVGFRIPPSRAVAKAETVTQEPIDPANGQHGALIRTVLAALLYELSVVTRPAYKDSKVQADTANPPDQNASDQISARSWDLTDAGLAVPIHHWSSRWR